VPDPKCPYKWIVNVKSFFRDFVEDFNKKYIKFFLVINNKRVLVKIVYASFNSGFSRSKYARRFAPFCTT